MNQHLRRTKALMYWISIPVLMFIFNYILYGHRIWTDVMVWLVSVPIFFAAAYFYWKLQKIYSDWVLKHWPSLEVTARRVLMTLGLNVLLVSPLTIVVFLFYDFFHILGYTLQFQDLELGYVLCLAINILLESIWQALYIIDKYKEVAAEKELIEQLQLQQEFENLKQKVNPHFLFNSFNTLSSLIAEDKEQAEKFLDELSKVYRYLLTSNESGISTLNQEIAFIRSYYRLLKTRYGSGLEMSLELPPEAMEMKLPSLSLQLLVENVVKHNVVSKTEPVHIRIYAANDKLIVENDLNKKAVTVESTGIGLSNIRDKYQLLHRDGFFAGEQSGMYRVELPLMT